MLSEEKKTDSGYSTYSSNYFRKYEKEFSERFGEAEKWKDRLRKEGKRSSELVGKFNYFLGCFVMIRDKLQEELLFGKENIRDLNVQVRRLGIDLESRLSRLEAQVQRRDTIRSEYDALKAEEKQATDSLKYMEIKQKCYYKKKEKEVIESIVVENASACQNIPNNIDLMKISIRQNELALEQGEQILSRVERAIEEINFVYQKIVLLLEGKKPILQITEGGDDVKK